METPAEIAQRWRYLRELLHTQLARFEDGTLQMHSGDLNVSEGVIVRLKREIDDFDHLIRISDKRNE